MAQIKDTNVIKTPEVTVRPEFFLPDGILDISVKPVGPESQQDDSGDEAVVVEIGDFEDAPPIVEEPDADNLKPPAWLNVISQQVRISKGGVSMVDVLVEVEDVPGAAEYQFGTGKRPIEAGDL